ncbi:MAG: hypothetical protein OEZ34_05930 [Spirochaetia bacterium]|nr:hypothetical protein [Spirochaetia bacterium]
MNKNRFIFQAVFIILFSSGELAALPGIELKRETGPMPIGDQLEYFEDKSLQFSIDDVSAPDFQGFQKSDKKYPAFGATKSAYWLRFRLQDGDPPEIAKTSQWMLFIEYPPLDDVIFFRKKAGKWEKTMTGDTRPFHTREINNRFFGFRLSDLSAGQDYYIRVKTAGAMNLPLMVLESNDFAKRNADTNLGYGIYFGIMIVMILYNFLIYLSLRDSVYIYYCAFIFGVILMIFCANGYAFQYFWPDYPIFANHMVMSSGFLMSAASLFYFRKFLRLSEHSPVLEKIFLLLALFGTLMVFISFFIEYKYKYLLFMVSGIIANLFVVPAIAKALIVKYRPARFFILAIAAWWLGGIIYILGQVGIIPTNFFIENAPHFGSALEVTLLSLALADRINEANREKIEEQIRLTSSYARFVPREFIELLGKINITEVKLGDAVEKTMTVLFSDIRSFTTISEGLSPGENYAFVNSILKRVGPIVRKNGGFIDKYIGDAVMALFPASPDEAVTAAIAIQLRLRKLNLIRQRKNLDSIAMGIGIHSGKLMLGTVGEKDRIDGTVISDTVNLTSRLEGLTKLYGASIIISETAFKQLKNRESYHLRILDSVQVKGKSQNVTILEIFDADPPEMIKRKSETSTLFQTGHVAILQKNYEKAAGLYRSVLDKYPEDSAAVRMLERLKELQHMKN